MYQIALVNGSTKVGMDEVRRVAAAIQRQVLNEFASVWQRTASVTALRSDEPIPPGCWAVYLRDKLTNVRNSGIHYYTEKGVIYANVEVDIPFPWSLVASHEVLEMISDPKTDELRRAPSIVSGQGEVEYLLEVCDPCQHYIHGYFIDDVVVSDFYAPKYFDTFSSSNGRYSMTGAITRPLQVLQGGYLSWRDRWGQWWMGTHSGQAGKINVAAISGFKNIPGDSIREKIDCYTAPLDTTGAYADLGREFEDRLAAKRAEHEEVRRQFEEYGKARADSEHQHFAQLEKRLEKRKMPRPPRFKVVAAAF